ncbi:MAG: hypothetical protein PHS32_06955 [Rhodoferax sp.]|uniref:hypothetical protein n=1 Tax=Rhodoferax sp. TaxID=50421 RepID=UPI002610D94E|nr:hypothetical protein [Rhodoferax sp.]MDD5333468.1 hypothetical protein [Rhodoferax sp.]
MKQAQKMRAMTLFSPAVVALALMCGGSVALAGNQVAGVTALVADMGIPIGLEGDSGNIKVNTKTDASGGFSFSGLKPGKYKLNIPGQSLQTIIIGKDGRLNGRVQSKDVKGTVAPSKSTIPVAGVHTIEGIETESDVVKAKDGEDGVNRTRPGNHKP